MASLSRKLGSQSNSKPRDNRVAQCLVPRLWNRHFSCEWSRGDQQSHQSCFLRPRSFRTFCRDWATGFLCFLPKLLEIPKQWGWHHFSQRHLKQRTTLPTPSLQIQSRIPGLTAEGATPSSGLASFYKKLISLQSVSEGVTPGLSIAMSQPDSGF